MNSNLSISQEDALLDEIEKELNTIMEKLKKIFAELKTQQMDEEMIKEIQANDSHQKMLALLAFLQNLPNVIPPKNLETAQDKINKITKEVSKCIHITKTVPLEEKTISILIRKIDKLTART